MKKSLLIILTAIFISSVYSQSWTHIQLEYPNPSFNTSFGAGLAMDSAYTIVGAPTHYGNPNGTVSFYKNNYVVDSIILKQELTNPSQTGKFGSSVSISGDYAVVGNSFESLDSIGQNSITYAGAAYVYKLTAGVWSLQQKIVAIDRSMGAGFGYSVAISDERILIVSNSSVYCFLLDNNNVWYQSQKIVYGNVIDVSIDGLNAVLGDNTGLNTINSATSGVAYLYKFDTVVDSFLLQTTITPFDGNNDDYFGKTVSIKGERIIIGAPGQDYDNSTNYLVNAGAAYIYNFDVNYNISLEQKIFASSRKAGASFGASVSIYNFLCTVGAPKDSSSTGPMGGLIYRGAAYIYKYSWNNWNNVKTKYGYIDYAQCGSSVVINNSFQITASLPYDMAQYSEPDGLLDIFKSTLTYDTTHYTGCNSYTDSNGVYYAESIFYLDTVAVLTSGNYHYYDINIISPIAQITVNDACPPTYTSPSGNYIYTQDGIYYDTIFIAGNPCDSVIRIDLKFAPINTQITVSGDSLIATNDSSIIHYQWLSCDNNYSIISNEISNVFVPNDNGLYAVELVSSYNCVDTSACYFITSISDFNNSFQQEISLYPNPSKGEVNIQIKNYQELVTLNVENMLGELIFSKKYYNSNNIKFLLNAQTGVYIIKLINNRGQMANLKVVLE